MSPENDLIALEIDKEITILFKYYLELIEQLDIPAEKRTILRKNILDHSNDSIRNILKFIDYFDFTINKEKVEAAAKKSIITRKFVISSIVSE